jgi:hypothetical protein
MKVGINLQPERSIKKSCCHWKINKATVQKKAARVDQMVFRKKK